MKSLYQVFQLITLIALLIACDTSRVYEDYTDFEEAFWHMDSIQAFSFDIEDPSKSYNLFATFRNGTAYPFYNLYFQYTLKDSTDSTLITELKEINFFDPKTGEPYGSGLGDLFDHRTALLQDYSFKKTGTYTLQLQQYMRMDTLPHLLSVGARVEFTQPE